jgi:hypothetical protein
MEGILGRIEETNKKMVILACNNDDSLIIDSARACNPYNIINDIDIDRLHSVFVISAESIYRFRSAIKLLPLWIKKYNIRNIYVTALSGFYSYDNNKEDYTILEETYKMLFNIELNYDVNVFLSVPNLNPYYSIIKKYCYKISNENDTKNILHKTTLH